MFNEHESTSHQGTPVIAFQYAAPPVQKEQKKKKKQENKKWVQHSTALKEKMLKILKKRGERKENSKPATVSSLRRLQTAI